MLSQYRLADILRTYVAVSGIDQKELANKWGCSESAVSRFLSRKSSLDMKTTCRVIDWMLAPYPNYELNFPNEGK